MIKPFLEIGPVSLRWYSLFIFIAIVLAYLLVNRESRRHKLLKDHIDNLFLIAIPLGIIGGRLYHVVDKWSYYREHLEEIFFIWQGGLGIFGALGLGVIGVYLYCRLQKLSTMRVLDLVTPFLLLGQSIGRLGNYFNSEGFGPPTDLPWKSYIAPGRRPLEYLEANYFHPTYLYESLWDFGGYVILIYLSRKTSTPGLITAGYLIIYGLGRILAETVRLDTWQVNGFKIGYLISITLVLSGVLLYKKYSSRQRR